MSYSSRGFKIPRTQKPVHCSSPQFETDRAPRWTGDDCGGVRVKPWVEHAQVLLTVSWKQPVWSFTPTQVKISRCPEDLWRIQAGSKLQSLIFSGGSEEKGVVDCIFWLCQRHEQQHLISRQKSGFHRRLLEIVTVCTVFHPGGFHRSH